MQWSVLLLPLSRQGILLPKPAVDFLKREYFLRPFLRNNKLFRISKVTDTTNLRYNDAIMGTNNSIEVHKKGKKFEVHKSKNSGFDSY